MSVADPIPLRFFVYFPAFLLSRAQSGDDEAGAQMHDDQHMPMSPQTSRRLLNKLESLFDQSARSGYCPHCIARDLLMGAGMLAAHELQADEMRHALRYIAELSTAHCPSTDAPARRCTEKA